MTGHPLEELEALAAGAAAPAELQPHLAGCPACRRELAWLRAESAMAGRALDATDGPVSPLWAAVEARLAPAPSSDDERLAPASPHQPSTARRRASAVGRPSSRDAAAGARPRLAARARRALLPSLAAAAAAAVLVVLVRAGAQAEAGDELPPSAALALAHADQEYRAAISVLEARVATRAGAGNHARARAGLSRARAAAREPGARVQLLEGYAAYLKSLRRALDEGEE